MLIRFVFIVKYFLYWLFFFIIIKTFFIFYNFHLASSLTGADWIGIFIHGMRLDISTVSYLLVLPFLILVLSIVWLNKYFKLIIKIYTYTLLILFGFLAMADCELYHYWGFRLDTTPLLYINTPKEMVASINAVIFLRQLFFWLLLSFLFIILYHFRIHNSILKIKKGKLWELPVFILCFVFLIIPIRGGTGLAPINVGSAYFSNNQFANHSAINVIWNAAFSILQTEAKSNPYNFFEKKEAQELFDKLSENQTPSKSMLSNKRPNVIIIILESFTAKAIKPLGGLDNITPRFNKLTHEGVFFDNFYSSGVRSDKGLVAIISGFPAQPNASIIRFPDKTQSLPSLAKDLGKEGYNSAYYYGGDIDFASMRSYITIAGYNKIIDMTNFSKNSYNSKWGVHDHIVFQRMLVDLDTASRPFFYTLFTLSSHEPFDVPMKTIIKGGSEDEKFLNSLYYTDSCLGSFIDFAKTKTWWRNTLIILVADHGVLRLGINKSYDPERFRIPMLWTGGAVKNDTLIHSINSQTDIPYSLLMQLNIPPSKRYKYSHDIFANSGKKYAFCAYNGGFIMLTDSSTIAYDTDEKSIKISEGQNPNTNMNYGKAYLQLLYNDFLNCK
jgi:phosphoglycerol transferase MdoB-like AlkP superfamily enzyme